MKDLGTLGGTWSQANGINNIGQVVGWTLVEPPSAISAQHAFIYSDGVMSDLNTFLPDDFGWVLTYASAINESGQIAVNGRNAEGITHAFLLTPVPEPATLSLLLLGGLAAVRKRRVS